MAKVDTIKLHIDGEDYQYNINVGKEGIFRCKLHWNVAEALGLKIKDIESNTLNEVKKTINSAYSDYLDRKTTYETFIAIEYQSTGSFNSDKEGIALHDHTQREFKPFSFSISDADLIAFDFGVFILAKYSTGTEQWYETRKGSGCVNYDEGEKCDPNTYYRYNSKFSKPKGKIIPYSEEALETLTKAREGIRSISEILYNVVSKDEKELESILLGGNLLK